MTKTIHSPGSPGGYGVGVTSSPRVLMALHDELLNGATISALRAVPLLEERGWSFSFWAPGPGPCFDWLAERGADVRGEFRPIVSGLQALREPPGVVRRLAASPGYLRRWMRALREVDPVLVHANSLFSYAEALVAHRRGRPTLLHVHDMAPKGKLRQARAICRRGVDHTVAVSYACAASYAYDGWEPGMVYEATPIPSTAVEIREAPMPFVVGTVGVVARRKGSDLFVDAARRLDEAAPGRFDFHLIGSPNDPLDRVWGDGVIAAAKAAGVTHLPEADVLAAFKGWDLFALPSRADPCPIVMLEAMASGLPVVGARTDGIAEQITPECGVLVDPDNAGALAEAIAWIADLSGSERRGLGAAGRARASSEFSLERQADGLNAAYRRTLESARAR